MKYATLAMVATAAAWAPVDPHAAKCAPLNANEVKALHVANLSKDTRDALLKTTSGLETAAGTKAGVDWLKLKLCYHKNSISLDQKAPTASTDKCATEWNTWETDVNDEWLAKCTLKAEKADKSSKGGMTTIYIVIGVVVVMILGGVGAYAAKLCGNKFAEGMYTDDCYEAFVDRETA